MTPKLWRLTLVVEGAEPKMTSKNYRDFDHARRVYDRFPPTFLFCENASEGNGWYRDLEAQERGA